MKKSEALKALKNTDYILTGEQIRSLSGEQISYLTAYQIIYLTAEQIISLSGEQIKAFVKDEEIPVIENFYSKMKNLLDNKKIIYKQSTFGENEKDNEVWNECGTAMCIAGHSRIAGGKLGYDLFKKTSYVLAARLTHLKNTPNTPIFNYMSSDDSEGLDYIEMMASFEQRQDKSIDFNQWLDTLSDD